MQNTGNAEKLIKAMSYAEHGQGQKNSKDSVQIPINTKFLEKHSSLHPVPTFNGRGHNGDDVMLMWQRQAITAPEDSQTAPQLAAQLGEALERQHLAVAQMVHWHNICGTQHMSN
jgi:hypothetical protein